MQFQSIILTNNLHICDYDTLKDCLILYSFVVCHIHSYLYHSVHLYHWKLFFRQFIFYTSPQSCSSWSWRLITLNLPPASCLSGPDYRWRYFGGSKNQTLNPNSKMNDKAFNMLNKLKFHFCRTFKKSLLTIFWPRSYWWQSLAVMKQTLTIMMNFFPSQFG